MFWKQRCTTVPSKGSGLAYRASSLSALPQWPPQATPTEQTIVEFLRQVRAQGFALENFTRKLEAVGVHANTRDEQIPTLCWAEFEKLVAIQSKP